MNGTCESGIDCAYPAILLYFDGYLLLNAALQQCGSNEGPTLPRAFAPAQALNLNTALREFSGCCNGHADCPGPAPLQRRFEMMAQTTPGAIAVKYRGRHLTYGELDAQADALALHLQAGGLIPGSFCVLDLEPSLAQVRAILAVLKAGAACLQFSSGVADAALAAVLAITQPALLITRGGSQLGATTRELRTICCDEDAADLPYGWPQELPIGERTPAYAFASVAKGDLCISVCTHQALEACVDRATVAQPGPIADVDPVMLWRPLSSGAPLTIQTQV
jgi:non-ribosomal peptide synthetase component F